MRGPVRLRWRAAAGARYYNVQVFRGSKRVSSSWPARPHLRLRLRPGRYRWYVWPGYGPLADHAYGHALGRSTFRVVAG